MAALVKINKQAQKEQDYLVCYYVRTNYEKLYNVHVPLALKGVLKKFSNKIIPSKLMTIGEDLKFYSALVSKLSNINDFTTFSLVFTATEHVNNKAGAFHRACDRVPNTLTIIRSNHGNVFGGYAEAPWMSKEHQTYLNSKGKSITAARYSIDDDAAFLFLIRSADKKINNKAPMVFPLEYAYLWYHYENGPSWGNMIGPELVIADHCDDSVNEQKRKQNADVIDYYADEAHEGDIYYLEDLPIRLNEASTQSSDLGQVNICGGRIKYSEEVDDVGGRIEKIATYGVQVIEYQVFSINFD